MVKQASLSKSSTEVWSTLLLWLKVSPEAPKENPETNSKENSMSSRIEALTIQEDVKEGEAEDEEGLPIYPYERIKISSTDPVTEIDVTKREVFALNLSNH